MKNRFQNLACGAIAALAVVTSASAARAEVLTYNFTGIVSSLDAAELATIGLAPLSAISGSFSYDTDAGWWGGSNNWADPSLALTVDQLPPTTMTSTWLTVEYNQGTFQLHRDAYSSNQVGARLTLSGQEIQDLGSTGALPSSLSFGSGASGILQLFLGGNFGDIDLTATLTSLTAAGSTSVPELDPASGAAAMVLVLGGATVLLGRRRRALAM